MSQNYSFKNKTHMGYTATLGDASFLANTKKRNSKTISFSWLFCLFVLFTLLISNTASSQSPSITTAESWVCPQGATSINVEAWIFIDKKCLICTY